MSPGKTEVKQSKFVVFISPAKGYFKETYKSQNKNPISPIPKFTLGIIQIKVKSRPVGKSIKNKLICRILISDFNLTQRSGVCVRSKCLLLC